MQLQFLTTALLYLLSPLLLVAGGLLVDPPELPADLPNKQGSPWLQEVAHTGRRAVLSCLVLRSAVLRGGGGEHVV